MRIVGGMFRGKVLNFVSDDITRPTSDRAKVGIFNILASAGTDFTTARVLDLFAGSGQMGIECISRGASHVVFNDSDARALEIVKKNLPPVFKGQISLRDFKTCLEKLRGQKFDLIFIDPPYVNIEHCTVAAELILQYGLLAPGGTIVAENENPDLKFPGFDCRQKNYGRAIIYFLTQCK